MVLFIVPIIAFASNSKQKTILYVSSFAETTYWSEKTEESLLKTFKSENYNINLRPFQSLLNDFCILILVLLLYHD